MYHVKRELFGQQWVEYVINLFDLEKLSVVVDVSEELKQKADLLARMLRGRFREHVKSRIKTVSKRSHWSMKLAYKNLAVSAACMVLTNHTKMDLKCLDESACLLGVNTNSFLPCAAFPDREGAYLYFDVNRGVFVRSGKVTRRGFVVRGDEHLIFDVTFSMTSSLWHAVSTHSDPHSRDTMPIIRMHTAALMRPLHACIGW
jgi:hypothetical protein